MKHAAALFAAAVLAAGLGTAQQSYSAFPRAEMQVNQSTLRTPGVKRHQTVGCSVVAVPREAIAGDPARNLHPTANVAYFVWVEKYGGGYHVKFRRSGDGGFSWEKEKTIYFQTGTADWDFEALEVGATFHQVYVAMSTAGPNKLWPDQIYLVASEDQGQTWTSPLMINTKASTLGKDTDEVVCDASLGRCHIAYEQADPSNNNDLNQVWYVGAEIKNGKLNIFKSDTRVSVHGGKPIFTDGVGYFDISSYGALVAIVYSSPRVSSNEGNLYCAVSSKFGTDFGDPKQITRITNWTAANPRTDPYWDCKVVCRKTNIYIVFGGNQVWPNNVYFTASHDMGRNFAKPVVVNKKGVGHDSDNPFIAADGDLVVLGYHDDRDLSQNNNGNSAFLVADGNAGKDILAGNFTEVRVDGPKLGVSRTEYPSVAVRGDRIVMVYEKSKYDANKAMGEDVAYIYSTDRGKSWSQPAWGTRLASLNQNFMDVDAPQVAMTHRGDVITWWADDRQSVNDLFTSGFKFPMLDYQGGGKGFRIDNLPATRNGDLALILVTEAGTGRTLRLDNMGFLLNFAIGKYTPIFLTSPAYITNVKSGVASFPYAPDGIGIFHALALGIEPKGLTFTWFTDPVVY